MSRWLIFDLDGTLVDSVPDLTASLNRLMAKRGLATFTEAEVTPMVGDGARALLERGFAARAAAMDEADLEVFLTDYTAHAAELSRAYPGVEPTLALLREAGWTMAVCTNKPVAAAHALLRELGLDSWFSAVGGGDSYPVRKPDPAHLLATLAACDGKPARAVMVGDHHNDILAATGAGIASVWVRWGYGRDVGGASAEAGAFAELPAVLERLVPTANIPSGG
jgi:phosphoglycolate phosphatase